MSMQTTFSNKSLLKYAKQAMKRRWNLLWMSFFQHYWRFVGFWCCVHLLFFFLERKQHANGKPPLRTPVIHQHLFFLIWGFGSAKHCCQSLTNTWRRWQMYVFCQLVCLIFWPSILSFGDTIGSSKTQTRSCWVFPPHRIAIQVFVRQRRYKTLDWILSLCTRRTAHGHHFDVGNRIGWHPIGCVYWFVMYVLLYILFVHWPSVFLSSIQAHAHKDGVHVWLRYCLVFQ